MRTLTRTAKAKAGPALDGLIGWQGVTARIPAEWNLGALGGDVRSGYLRVDDEHQPRLEVKWSNAGVNLDQALTRYLGQLTKKARRADKVEITRDTRLVSNRQQPGKRLECFSWQSHSQQAHGLIWRCEHCRRTLIVQVLGSRAEELAPLARGVLGSLEDHERDGCYTWALYGFCVDVPKEFELMRQKLMAGYLDLQFEQGRRRLRVTRWGMAQMALGARSVPHWVEIEYLRRRDVHWRAFPLQQEGHPAAGLGGERRRPFHWLRKQAEYLLRFRSAIIFSGKVWYCEPSNRLYAVEEVHARDRACWPRVADSIRCH